eukprot:5935010-Pleurochrysis_carterae.AAC.4
MPLSYYAPGIQSCFGRAFPYELVLARRPPSIYESAILTASDDVSMALMIAAPSERGGEKRAFRRSLSGYFWPTAQIDEAQHELHCPAVSLTCEPI